jgi:SAM-dependent methyltransferase
MPKSYDQLVLQHYDAQAQEHGLEPTSTMLDLTTRQRETQLIEKFLSLVVSSLRCKGRIDSELAISDVGCGNGFTIQVLSKQYPDINFQGFEFTPSLLEVAQSRFRTARNTKVSHGDVRYLEVRDEQFDVVLCQRVLINLLDPVDQRAGLAELARITRPGGYLLSIEAFEGPLARLNTARAEFGLPPLPSAHHNRYLPDDFYSAEASLIPVTGPMLDPSLPLDFLPSNFLSSHYFVSRVLHPLALGPQSQFIRNSHFVLFLTEAFSQPIGDYAPIKAYAFQKVIL